MPPEAAYCRSLVTPIQSLHSRQDNHKRYCQRTKKMKFTKMRIIPLLVLTISTISILGLLFISLTTCPSSSSPPLPAFRATHPENILETYPNLTVLTEKEFRLVADLVDYQAPCNLLVFGLEPEYMSLSLINRGGNTVFLEDDPDKILSVTGTNSNAAARVYRVEYDVPAREAYELLRHAREEPACANPSGSLGVSECRLALRDLPREVYELAWDVVVVDGPSGDSPEAPGRMAAIYTAAKMAREGGDGMDVLVHDVDRTIERWFSWEFLCDENLVSSKGKFWNFRITGRSNSTEFCSSKPVVLV